MERYGSYEALREIGSSYGAVVYAARRAGEQNASYAVKVFSPDALAETRGETGGFGAVLEIQKRAAGQSPRVAPILEHGQAEQGHWHVTRLFPLTVEKLIAGKVALDGEGIFHVVSRIVQGALDIKRQCGRPHGNLKPGNVLIDGAKKITETEILLTDPSPGSEADSSRLEASDLRKTGEILYQLVKRREITESSDALALTLDTPEWNGVFGKKAAAWKQICTRLLDPQGTPGGYTLEKLDEELKELAPKPPVSPKVLLATAAAVVILAAGAAAFFILGNKGKLSFTSDPPGVDLYMNGAKVGTTPLEMKLTKGTYAFEAKLGPLPSQKLEAVVEGRKTRIEHAFRFDYGNVVVLSDPPGARVKRIDAGDVLTDMGTTPYTNLHMAPAEALRFRLDLERHESAEVELTVPGGGRTEQARATLQPVKAGEELVEISSSLPGQRTVTLNGGNFKNSVVTLPIKKSMPAGTYEVTASYPYLEAVRKTVEAGPGKSNKVVFDFEYGVVDLKPEPGQTEIWLGNTRLGMTPTNLLWKPGDVELELRAEGYYSQPFTVRVLPRAKSSPAVKLKRKDVEIVLRATPPVSAEVYETTRPDQVLTNLANGSGRIRLPQGQFNLAARVRGLGASKVVPLTVTYGKEIAPLTFAFSAGVVTLQSDPPGASFDVGTNSVTLGSNTWALTAGAHEIRAEYPGLEPVVETQQVAEGGTGNATLRFKYGVMVLLSEPLGAEIKGPGIPASQKTPYTNFFVRPNDYPITFTLTNKPKARLAKVRDRERVVVMANYQRPDLLTFTNKIGMELVYIRDGLYMGKWEVSQGQYAAIFQTNSQAGARPNSPAVFVSPDNARLFCSQLTKLDDSLKANELVNYQYDVPTLDEWRLAAGAITNANVLESVFNTNPTPQDIFVSRGSTNAFGLYDMFGNVSEWCVSTNQQWAFIGGSIVNAKPTTRFLLASAARSFWYSPVTNAELLRAGFRETGFRCVLREVR